MCFSVCASACLLRACVLRPVASVEEKKEVAPTTGSSPALAAVDTSPPPVSYFSLYRFATNGEIAVLCVAVFSALLNGAALPGT